MSSSTTSSFIDSVSDTASSSAPTSFTPPIPLPTPSDRRQPPGSVTTNASLYLYTFLATLIILLGVSVVIVFRSYVLRRRQQRSMAAAVANGTYMPPGASRSRGVVDLSKKPRLWDVPVYNPDQHRSYGEWDLQPFATLNCTPPSYPPPPQSPPTSPRNITQRLRSLMPTTDTAQPSSAQSSSPPIPLTTAKHIGKIQIGVMILMPSLNSIHPKLRDHDYEDEEDLPWVEMGVLKVRVHGPDQELDFADGGGKMVEG